MNRREIMIGGAAVAAVAATGLKDEEPKLFIGVNGSANASKDAVLATLRDAPGDHAETILRIERAPERRIFFVDVGRMPTIKAEAHMRAVMAKHANRLSPLEQRLA
jgi:hypothetical protein